jgi:P-type Cu2+ transporter
MPATRDFSHYVKDVGSGLKHIDLAVEGVNCAGLHVQDRARASGDP